jgi:hypothetical protein
VGNYVQSLLPLKGGAMAVGCYGAGVRIITLPGQSRDAWRQASVNTDSNNKNAIIPSEPQGARPPSARELTAMASAIRNELIKARGEKQPRIVPLPDDWRTEGNWLGRYGKYWMCLFAARESVGDIVWAPSSVSLHHDEFSGPHTRLYRDVAMELGDGAALNLCLPPSVGLQHISLSRGLLARTQGPLGPPHVIGTPEIVHDPLRYWIQAAETSARRELQLPTLYAQEWDADHDTPHASGRRGSQIDDHGEVYPHWWQGPNVNFAVRIPPGRFTLSIYDTNDNGHGDRCRDYPVSIQEFPATAAFPVGVPKRARQIKERIYEAPAKLVGRLNDFWKGVWLRFWVRGPVAIVVRVSRGGSLNAILAGAAIDSLNEHPFPYYFGRNGWARRLRLQAAARKKLLRHIVGGGTKASGAAAIIKMGDCLLYRRPRVWEADSAIFYTLMLRHFMSLHRRAGSRRQHLGSIARADFRLCRFHAWETAESRLGIRTPRQIETSLRWNGVDSSYAGLEATTIRRQIRREQREGGRR